MVIRKGFMFLIFLLIFTSPTCEVFTQKDSVTIERAENDVFSAFEAVLEVERIGVNVSDLIVELNEAGDLLTEAKISLRNGDVNKAVDLAGLSVEIANDVKEEASILRVSALSHNEFVYKFSLMFSLFGVPAFLLSMFSLWRWFRGLYMRNLLGFRPEVADDFED